jgi:MFS family permease
MFYLYEFILQVSPGVMTNELMHDLGLNAAGLGALSAFYFYAYTPMQIPAGLLFDRFGPRLLITIALLICAAGALFFGLTQGLFLASAGRLFMGVGSAFSFIGALLLVARWFPPAYFALLAGIVQLMSSVGAMVGEVPLAAAVAHYGWRETINTVAIAGFILAIIVWLFVKDWPPGQQQEATQQNPGELKRLRYVVRKAQTWWIGLYSFTSWAPITVFASLWGVPYLATLYHFSATQASAACSMIWLGIGIGSPLIGWWSDKIQRRCLPLTLASLLGVITLSLILYAPVLPLAGLYLVLFIFGLAASGQSLSFALVKDINMPQVVGTAIGFNNMAVVAGGALFQPLVGWLLHVNWDGQSLQGIPVYSVNDYRSAMIILPVCYLLGTLISMKRLRETNCQAIAANNVNNDSEQFPLEAITP